MERLSKCFRFNFKIALRSSTVFAMIYAAIYLIMIAATALQPDAKDHVNNTSFGFAASIFLFVLFSVMFSGSFNALMLLGNTRKAITTSLFATGTCFAAILGVLAALLDQLNIMLAQAFGIKAYKLLDFIYPQPLNFAEDLLWYFGFMLLVAAFGLLYGALSYKFGKTFIICFWVGFGLVISFLPLLLGAQIINVVKNALMFFFAFGKAGGSLLALLNFAVTAGILSLITWLIARRQPQNA